MDGYDALVEFANACPGKGEYIAIVYYGSKIGEVFKRSFRYSRKDPRDKDEAQVLQDITRRLGTRHRDYLISISVVKRCLHPKSPLVARVFRRPHFERVFSKVIRHPQTSSLEDANGRAIALPYTPEELRWLPVHEILGTEFGSGPERHAVVEIRGVEQVVDIRDLTAVGRL